MAALDDLTYSWRPERTWTARALKVGSTQPSISTGGQLSVPQVSILKSVANAAVGGGDQLLSQVFPIAGAATLTLDLMSFTDALGRAAGSFARIKRCTFWLLGTADDTTGTACSGVTVGNAATNAHLLFLGGAAMTFTVGNGEIVEWATRSAAGKVVDATHKSVLITNDDAVVAASLFVEVVGGST